MLVLARKVGEKIRIDKDIEIIVLGQRSKQVKIGINAPEDVNIRRSELAVRNKD